MHAQHLIGNKRHPKCSSKPSCTGRWLLDANQAKEGGRGNHCYSNPLSGSCLRPQNLIIPPWPAAGRRPVEPKWLRPTSQKTNGREHKLPCMKLLPYEETLKLSKLLCHLTRTPPRAVPHGLQASSKESRTLPFNELLATFHKQPQAVLPKHGHAQG